ncbi:MAG: transketolase [Kiritimatiellae bacterium]|nr:transketolase [Kiritimatiellia bacterium]
MKLTADQMKLVSSTVRCLCADIVEKAKSGHPGAALGMADLASVLWLEYLNVDPKDPLWAGRDRLVFSGGHASALVYALFHLAGMGGLSMDELKTFRQLDSRCAGHPERGVMPGVEVTTGPLGQGVAMGVGLALAAKKAKIQNKTWVFCGDGDLEEGISHEACSWAGAMKLDDFILVYDSNHITIEGDTSLAMADDAKRRFESYGWKVLEVDGHDIDAIDRVYRRATHVKGQPVVIIATTHIAFGAPTKHDTADSHGAPLGADEVAGLKTALGFDPAKSFYVPKEVYDFFSARTGKCHRFALKWKKAGWKKPVGDMAGEEALLAAKPDFPADKPVATRSACGTVMNALAPLVPGLVGGSADLAPSNKTYLKGLGDIGPGSFDGRNVHFGIRELGMSAIVNGITAFDETFRGYGATFCVFSDYCRPAIRVAALMETPSIFVFSHDSYCVGEDGPTHEPVEQLAALRAMPNVMVWRPADANETFYAWVEMLKHRKGPSCILTTRQNLPILEGVTAERVAKGGYVIFQSGVQDSSTIVFVASGSEVGMSVEAAKRLSADGVGVRVVSLPCVERFLEGTMPAYRDEVLPPAMRKRVIVEAGSRLGLDRFREDSATTVFVTLDRYGASAPYKVLSERFGFTADNILARAKELL